MAETKECPERRALTQLYWAAVREYNVAAAKQLWTVVHSGQASEPANLAKLQERKEHAKNALLAHLSAHGCTRTD